LYSQPQTKSSRLHGGLSMCNFVNLLLKQLVCEKEKETINVQSSPSGRGTVEDERYDKN